MLLVPSIMRTTRANCSRSVLAERRTLSLSAIFITTPVDSLFRGASGERPRPLNAADPMAARVAKKNARTGAKYGIDNTCRVITLAAKE